MFIQQQQHFYPEQVLIGNLKNHHSTLSYLVDSEIYLYLYFDFIQM